MTGDAADAPAPMEAVIPGGVLAAIADHARREQPNECCGLLVGAGATVDEAIPARNLRHSPTRYQVDPAVHVAANRRLRGTGRAVIGAYHSHPRTPPRPSPSDLVEAHYPEYIWLIVSLAAGTPEFRAWRIADGRATEVAVLIPDA